MGQGYVQHHNTSTNFWSSFGGLYPQVMPPGLGIWPRLPTGWGSKTTGLALTLGRSPVLLTPWACDQFGPKPLALFRYFSFCFYMLASAVSVQENSQTSLNLAWICDQVKLFAFLINVKVVSLVRSVVYCRTSQQSRGSTKAGIELPFVCLYVHPTRTGWSSLHRAENCS